MSWSLARAASALACLLLATQGIGCDDPVFTEPKRLGGQSVSAEVLNEGVRGYRRYCQSCHGRNGDGRGPSAESMDPAPRDFTTGVFMYTSTAVDLPPSDDDLLTIIRNGSPGTRMNGFDGLSDEQLFAIVQYIKTFSDLWSTEFQGD